jgi:hypothetical protein
LRGDITSEQCAQANLSEVRRGVCAEQFKTLAACLKLRR